MQKHVTMHGVLGNFSHAAPTLRSAYMNIKQESQSKMPSVKKLFRVKFCMFTFFEIFGITVHVVFCFYQFGGHRSQQWIS
jgi:hypothetical protein